ncbi:hypothetical protein HK104_009806 [Borealophlyctis nickersoniae]|nr:hypothetical protein HK104_009806 [Borealophlyctis nickersoniae]
MNGYDGSLMASIYDTKQFQDKFHVTPESTTMSSILVLYHVGSWAAAFIAGPASDRLGRKMGMGVGAVVVAAGTLLMGFANEVPMLLAGRFLAGFGVVITTSSAPAYIIELCHPAYRGRIGGMYNTLWFVGNMAASWVAYGTQKWEGDMAWKLPIWAQLLPPAIMLLGLPFMPESPRWLISRGRTEQARDILITYHADGNPRSQLVQLEYEEMMETTPRSSSSSSNEKFWDYSSLFRTRSARWRFLMMFFIAFFGQQSGISTFTHFFPTVARQAGVTSQDTRLLLVGVKSCVQFLSAIVVGGVMTDKLSRRSLLLLGTLLFPIWLSILAVTTSTATAAADAAISAASPAMVSLTVFAVFAFSITDSVTWTPMQALYPIECLTPSTRVKGMSLSGLITYATVAVNQYIAPLGLAALGWKYYVAFAAWDMVEAGVMYLFLVETKGWSGEELDEVFEEPVPARSPLQRHRGVRRFV